MVQATIEIDSLFDGLGSQICLGEFSTGGRHALLAALVTLRKCFGSSGIDYSCTLSRARFEALRAFLVASFLSCFCAAHDPSNSNA